MTTKRTPEKKLPPRLDPVLPLPEGTGIPAVRHDEGKEIFANSTHVKMVELPYRSFYAIWEQVELRASQNYPRYVGGALDDVAQTWLEAAHAFRSAARDQVLPVMTEEKAQRARQILTRHDAEVAKAARRKKPAEATQEAPESEPVKRARCRETYDGGDRCLGPEEHKGRHKDRLGNRW